MLAGRGVSVARAAICAVALASLGGCACAAEPGSAPDTPLWAIPSGQLLEAPSLSADGRVVVFTTSGSLPGSDDDDAIEDVIAYDVATRAFTLLTHDASDGTDWARAQTGAVSDDGRFVAYLRQSAADDERVHIDLLDREAATITVVQGFLRLGSSEVDPPVLSGDGHVLAWREHPRSPATESLYATELGHPSVELWRSEDEHLDAAVLDVATDGARILYTAQVVSREPSYGVLERASPSMVHTTSHPIALSGDGFVWVPPGADTIERGSVDDLPQHEVAAAETNPVWRTSPDGESFAINAPVARPGLVRLVHRGAAHDIELPIAANPWAMSVANDGTTVLVVRGPTAPGAPTEQPRCLVLLTPEPLWLVCTSSSAAASHPLVHADPVPSRVVVPDPPPEPAALHLDSAPSGQSVSVAGAVVGMTPIVVPIPGGGLEHVSVGTAHWNVGNLFATRRVNVFVRTERGAAPVEPTWLGDEFEAVYHGHDAQVRACIGDGWNNSVLEVEVDAQGEPREAVVQGLEAPEASCLTEAAMSWRFPPRFPGRFVRRIEPTQRSPRR